MTLQEGADLAAEGSPQQHVVGFDQGYRATRRHRTGGHLGAYEATSDHNNGCTGPEAFADYEGVVKRPQVYDAVEVGAWNPEASGTAAGAQEHLVGPRSLTVGQLEVGASAGLYRRRSTRGEE